MSVDRLASLLAEYADLERRLADPAIHADRVAARRVGRRFAELTPIRKTADELDQARADLEAARELAAEAGSVDGAAFEAEAQELAGRIPVIEERLAELLAPRDPNDIKDVTVAVKTRGAPEGGYGVWSRLKWEGGVHRVQRVPVTEAQGRIHTSAAGVLVTPEAEETEVEIDEKDLRVDVFRSSGPGGQSVNTTDSAVRITNLPTGIVVSCQNERSQLQNKDRAMRMLRAKLAALAEERAAAAASDARRSQVRTVDRSERIRTYNFPQNRITDHRIGYTAYNLELVLAGDLDGVLEALVEADRRARLAGADQLSRR